MSIFFLILFSVRAEAFNSFHWLNDTTRSSVRIAPRSDINGEYDSDFVAYQNPLEWQFQMIKAKNAFDLSVGSLSSKEFLFDQRLKLEKDLNSRIFFQLDWLNVQDYEQDVEGFGYELGYRISPKFSLSVIGSPSFYKSEDDVGVKFNWQGEDSKSELGTIWYDFQNNQRSLNNRRWAKGEAPVAVFYQFTWQPEGVDRFSRFGVMNQFHSRMEDKTGPTTEENSAFRMYFQHWEKYKSEMQWQWDQVFRNTTADGKVQRKRLWVQYEKYFFYRGIWIKPGLHYFYRDYQTDGPHIFATTWLPTIWFETPPRSRGEMDSIWALGLDAAFFDADRGDAKSGTDQRLNLKNTLRFATNVELSWLLTFDIDQLISNEFWEGGNVQFRSTF